MDSRNFPRKYFMLRHRLIPFCKCDLCRDAAALDRARRQYRRMKYRGHIRHRLVQRHADLLHATWETRGKIWLSIKLDTSSLYRQLRLIAMDLEAMYIHHLGVYFDPLSF